MTTELNGQHAMVTGASRGIGAAIADALEAAGARVSRLARTPAAGIIACDVSREEQVAAAFVRARAAHGPLHILINNAGSVDSAPFAQSDMALLERMLAVHLKGAWACTQAALEDLLAAPAGRIVNIASIAGQRGFPYVAAYCAAKHGLIGLTRALAAEYAKSKLTVNALCPGYTDTDLVYDAVRRIAARSGRPPDQVRASLAAHNPQGRLIAPDEVAAAALWLCSSQSAALNGQSISISGGEITP